MCSTCGCGEGTQTITITKIGEEDKHEHFHAHQGSQHDHRHHHTHGDNHDHHHHHHTPQKTVIDVEQDIMLQNNLFAARNRGYFEAKHIKTINLVSSPGSGKTTLLEESLIHLQKEFKCYVIEGDQQTSNDANRIAQTKAPVVQINTGRGCHLDADMIHRSLKQLKPENDALLFIENVGNLVCPALFDLGENARVVIMSVTEGDDKPIKYPDMFHSANLCIINKTDLLPYVQFDIEKAKEYALRINPKLKFIELSATKGEGMEKWFSWLRGI
jgi:hydrogenase nickel incorporation protein HypB